MQPTLLEELSARVSQAMRDAGMEGDPAVRASQDSKFGDYQANGVMAAAKKLGRPPRELAHEILQRIDVTDLCPAPEIAGPGFINFRVHPEYVAARLARMLVDTNPGSQGEACPGETDVVSGDRLGIPIAAKPETIVIDFSSPNLAKEMHIGHLRSTVIGDCLARILEFAGHRVIRENHVGDWGTQFGMLLAFLSRSQPEVLQALEAWRVQDLEAFYVQAKSLFDQDDDFKNQSREMVVALQKGDPVARRIWRLFCDESLRHCHAIYDRLGVKLLDRGESYYADLMDEVVRRLDELLCSGSDGFVAVSHDALCLFPDGFATREGEPLPLIVRKSDGGFNYATSDLATILHRIESLRADRILYVVGAPQQQHFDMLFASVRRLGWVSDAIHLQHIKFGSVLSSSGRPIKTREGGTVKLKDVLDEAAARALAVIHQQGRLDPDSESSVGGDSAHVIAESIGMAAVKYFDLSHELTSDYQFDMDTMLSLEGNTAPYMLYAYARIRSIQRKAGPGKDEAPLEAPIRLENPAEIALGKFLVRFPEIMQVVTADLRPNVLTEYLYELSKTFSRFYDKRLGVRVIDAESREARTSRLALCDLTARTLRIGLQLLGIRTVEQM